MGFYGNITNIARTQFTFDKIYPNRLEMQKNKDSDGVYAGRYVLVEYDTDIPVDYYNSSLYCVQLENSDEYQMYHRILQNGVEPDLLFAGVNPSDKVNFIESRDESGVEVDQIVRILAGNKYTNISTSVKYIELNDTVGDSYYTSNETAFNDYWKGKYKYENYTIYEQLEPNSSAGKIKMIPSYEGLFSRGEIIRIDPYHSYCRNKPIPTKMTDEFWMAEKSSDGKIKWRQIGEAELQNYFINWRIDFEEYKNGRGYDSTVWEKVYTNNTEKYVMIAELNTVVPTFDVVADAPTTLPLSPHFDANSNNVYYRLHWQPQWGLRTKAAKNYISVPRIDEEGREINSSKVTATNDEVFYPSDQKTSWSGSFINLATDEIEKKYFNSRTESWDDKIFSLVPKALLSLEKYNSNRDGIYYIKNSNGKMELASSSYNASEDYYMISREGDLIDAAIYFNKDGFNSEKVVYSSDLIETNEDNTPRYESYNYDIAESGWIDEDRVTIAPTGLSGHVYSPHNGTLDMKAQPDIQELSVMLPSVGNTMAQIWDIVYGGRETNNRIATSSVRNRDISWENANEVIQRNGLRLVREKLDGNGYEICESEGETLAGCINSVHDLMGMIIVDKTIDENTDIEGLNPYKIYYNPENGKFYRKHKIFNYEELPYKYVSKKVTEKNYSPYCYFATEDGADIVIDNFEDLQKNDDNESVTLFYKSLSEEAKENLYEEVVFSPWKKGLYEKLSNSSYEYHDEDYPIEGLRYYELQEDSVHAVSFDNIYTPNLYYENDPEHPDLATNLLYSGYKLCKDEYAIAGKQYYEINPNKTIAQNAPFNDRKFLNENGTLKEDVESNFEYLYLPDCFYYEDNFVTLDNKPVVGLTKETRPQNELSWNEDGTLNDTRQYYILHISEAQADSGIGTVYIPEGNNLIPQDVVINYTKLLAKIPVTLRKKEGKIYFISNKIEANNEKGTEEQILNYTLLTDDILKKHYNDHFNSLAQIDVNKNLFYKEYFKFLQDGIQSQLHFYTKDTFWYQPEGTKNWTIDDGNEIYPITTQEYIINDNTESIIIHGTEYPVQDGKVVYNDEEFVIDENNKISIPLNRQYYQEDLIFLPVVGTFYEPDKFYTKNEEDEYIKVNENGITDEQIKYYKSNDIYVYQDLLGIYKEGSLWNNSLDEIPATVKLGLRTDDWELQELPKFARELNTIHGLILRINEILESGDEKTRDTKTVQGAINKLNDIIDRFTLLEPRQFTIVDSYGRIHSSPWTTAQSFSTTNWQESLEENKNVKESKEDRWIVADINPNPKSPMITINHQLVEKNKILDTETKSDKNIPLNLENSGNNDSHSDSIKIQTPIVDAAGHVVGKNEEEIVLPFGFKILKAENSSEDGEKWSQSAGSTHSENESVLDIIADNTQDSLSIVGGNKWIRLQTSGDGDNTNSISTGKDVDNILTIAHETHDFDTEFAEHTNLNKEEGAAAEENLTIYDWDYDIAGHITKKKAHTYTLPFGFKTFKIAKQSELVTNLESNQENIIADNTQDEFTFATGNKWIKMANDTNLDTFTIGHEVNIIKDADIINTTDDRYNSELSTESSLSDENNSLTFSVPDITWDEAGHITSHSRHTYTMPNNYGKINGDMGETEASSTHDTFSVKGDSWLLSTITSDTITITHQDANEVIHQDVDNLTPTFGDTFEILDLDFDTKGHYYGKGSHTVKIPGLTFTDDTSGNIVTDISYKYDNENHLGNFTENRALLGNIQLGVIDDTTEIEEEFLVLTINTPLSKALNILDIKIEKIDDRVEELESKTNPRFDSIKDKLNEEEDGVFVLRFTKKDGEVTPEWVYLEEWKKGDRKY